MRDACAERGATAVRHDASPRLEAPSCWLTLFSEKTWTEFVAAGSSVLGFRDGSVPLLRSVKPGDWLIAYVTRVSRFVGIFVVESDAFHDETPIWTGEPFPHRVRVRADVTVPLEGGVDIHTLLDQFSWAATARSPTTWQGQVQNTLRRWRREDADVVRNALLARRPTPR